MASESPRMNMGSPSPIEIVSPRRSKRPTVKPRASWMITSQAVRMRSVLISSVMATTALRTTSAVIGSTAAPLIPDLPARPPGPRSDGRSRRR